MSDVTSNPTWTFPKWVDMADVAAPSTKPPRSCQCVLTQDAIAGGDIHFHVCAACALAAAYERGLRRGMAIAKENEEGPYEMEVEWNKAEAQMEREIEEAKR